MGRKQDKGLEEAPHYHGHRDRLRARFREGVPPPERDGDLVAATVANVLGIHEQAGRPIPADRVVIGPSPYPGATVTIDPRWYGYQPAPSPVTCWS